MEINITWNVCRICLQEQNMTAEQIHGMQINAEIGTQIYELTGITIKLNDSLPQKICKKCLHVLKQAVHFRTTCRNSDSYLQDILEKAKSTSSLFTMDKPNKNVFDIDNNDVDDDDNNNDDDEDIIEQSPENLYDETQILDRYVSKRKRKHVEKNTEPFEKKRKDHNNQITKNTNSFKKDSIESDLECDRESNLIAVENNLLTRLPLKEEIPSKRTNQLDFGSMFLNKDTTTDDEDEEFLTSQTDSLKLKRSKERKKPTNHVESNNFLEYKTLDVTLDSNVDDDNDVQDDDEIIQTNNLSTVDISNNDDNQELFFIFSDDVISSKQDDNETSTNHENDQNQKNNNTILVQNMEDIIDNIAENSNDDRNFDEFVDSESNTLDQVDCIEDDDEDDDDFIKCDGGVSREATKSNNENENFYEQDNFIERTTLYIEETTDDFDKSNEDSYIIKPMETKKNHACPICGNHFNTRTTLKHHMRLHRNERNYECELCGKRFTAACNLTTHMRTHTGEKPFVCHFCERRFSDKSTHVKHERSHTDERPYSCTICQKAFTLSSSLKAHKRVHTGEKPYSCYTCAKSFKLPHQLKAHFSTISHKIRAEESITPN